jgi:hypothetical protein
MIMTELNKKINIGKYSKRENSENVIEKKRKKNKIKMKEKPQKKKGRQTKEIESRVHKK